MVDHQSLQPYHLNSSHVTYTLMNNNVAVEKCLINGTLFFGYVVSDMVYLICNVPCSVAWHLLCTVEWTKSNCQPLIFYFHVFALRNQNYFAVLFAMLYYCGIFKYLHNVPNGAYCLR